MIVGMSLSTFTTVHVIISLIAIAAGLRALAEMLQGKLLASLTAVFLITTVLTSITGFMFPGSGAVTPAQIVGAISLIALALAILALYVFKLRSAWRWIYVVTAVLSLYLNCFVAVVQAFQKIPVLNALAPTQSEMPFQIAQIILLAVFIWAGIAAFRKFHPAVPTIVKSPAI
jgi:hypothetical protein